MLIAAYTIGATHGYIYIRAEYPLAIRRLRAAIAALRELGLLGERILGSDFSFDITIKEGAGAFVCGEETALIASIEGSAACRGRGRRSRPSRACGASRRSSTTSRPWHPAEHPAPRRRWYASLGTETSKGTKTFSLVGKVRRTGLIEVPLGTTLRSVI